MTDEHELTEAEVQKYLDMFKRHEIDLIGGYTTDTTWGYYSYADTQEYTYFGYDAEGNPEEGPATEQDVVNMLRRFGKRVVRPRTK